MSVILEMKNITKVFPRVIANDHISFQLKKGTVHALLGENGAGKSTLMNCLYGLYKPDEGEIFINGKKTAICSSDDAISHGVGMVHQHFMLIPELTVTENIILGMKSKRPPLLDVEDAQKRILELSEKYEFNINPRDRIRDLSVGTRQRVEILKLLYKEAEIIILDEATAVLTPQEIREFFGIIKKLVKEGKSILIITHKLGEVMELADEVTVLRDGKVINNVRKEETNPRELAKMMVGREILFDLHKEQQKLGPVLLSVEKLSVRDKNGVQKVKDISFEIRGGEILGIAGVDGNGQMELSNAVTGVIPFDMGTVTIKDKKYSSLMPRDAYKAKMSHIPQDRQQTGLVLDLSILKNLILTDKRESTFSRKGIMNYRKVNSHAKEMLKEYNIIAPGVNSLARELSGGNQQKVILARELSRNPDIMVANQPTRGLDIGATEFLRQKLVQQRDKGVAVLLISTELEEIMQIADRIAVIYEGQIMGIVDKTDVDINELGLMMAGVRKSEEA